MSSFGPPRPSRYQVLERKQVTLEVRQHPAQALVTHEHKEKARKPVDPPPIVQLKLANPLEASGNYLVNPFLFMNAVLVEAEEQETGGYRGVAGNQIIGQNVSSLHRLKDIDNRDGGFFVFGDLSCRKTGLYRLQFNLFDFDKDFNQSVFVDSVVSNPFRVLNNKDFRGLMESTHLSRTFSDQGVRLRLRKEPRTLSGTKRGWDTTPPESSTPPLHQQTPYGGQVQQDSQYGYAPSLKRQRSDSEYSNPNAYPPTQYTPNLTPQYNTGHAWPVQHPQTLQTSFSNAFGSMLPQGHTQSATSSLYNRTLPQSSFSAPATAMGTNPYFNTNPLANGPRDYQTTPQTQSHGGSYSAQLPSDAYSTIGGSQSDSRFEGYAAPSSAGESASRLSDLSSALSQPLSTLSHQDSSSSIGQYRTRPMAASYQSYQSAPSQAIESSPYDQPASAVGPQYGRDQYSSPPNPYSDASRGAYQLGRGSDLPESNRPLDSAMLNRSFATYAGEDVSDPSLGDIQPYHTPHQSRPMG